MTYESSTAASSKLQVDVLFWLEVQKYKAFCHSQTDPKLVREKVVRAPDSY